MIKLCDDAKAINPLGKEDTIIKNSKIEVERINFFPL